jgi:lathosterol oxidase
MDLILRICDDLFFDKLWSHLVPLSAFSPSPDSLVSLNGSAIIDIPVVDSKWSQLVSYLPHPPLPPHELSSSILSYSSSISAAHTPRLISAWPRDYIPRQVLSLFAMTSIGITILYFTFAWLSYKFIFNHDMMRHPRFLKNQIKLEIQCSLRAFPGMILLTLPWFQAEVMGYSKLYDDVEQYGWFYLFASVPL